MSADKSNNSENQNKLLSEFSQPDFASWQEKADELLGKSPETSRSFDLNATGLRFAPIFRAEDIAELDHLNSRPGEYPYVRAGQLRSHTEPAWLITQAFPAASAKEFNRAAKLGLKHGLSALTLTLDRAGQLGVDPDQARVGDVGWEGLSLANTDELAQAFDGIDLTKQPLKIDAGCATLPLAANLALFSQREKLDLKKLTGWFTFDPLAELAAHGETPIELSAAYDELAAFIKWNAKATSMTSAQVSCNVYQEAGLSAAEQLGCLLATAVAYFRAMESRGISPEEFTKQLSIGLSIGPKLFVEIAKVRACRLVWAALIRELSLSSTLNCPKIHLTSSASNRTLFDQHLNLLRGATEAFSAIVGGCDSLTIIPFDHGSTSPNDFSLRLARNHQLIMKHEAHLGAVTDPAGGSYYVEKLTNSLAEKAWEKFVEIEMAGGIVEFHKTGRIAEWTGARITEISERIARRHDIVVGVNKFVNLDEKLSDAASEDQEAIHNARTAELIKIKNDTGRPLKPAALTTLTNCWDERPTEAMPMMIELTDQGATLGEISKALRANRTGSSKHLPLTPFRPAEMFEELRQSVIVRAGKSEAIAKIMIAPVGISNRLKPRIDFINECFAVAGLKAECEKIYTTADDALFSIDKTKPTVVVLCATDDDYPEIVPVMCELIKKSSNETMICLAGYPTDYVDTFKTAGVDDFIYQGVDLYSLLVRIGNKLGVLR